MRGTNVAKNEHPKTYVIQNISNYNQVPKTCLFKISTYLRSTSYNIHEKVKLTFKKNKYQLLTLSQKATASCEYHVFNLFWGREKGVDSGRTALKTFCVVPSLTTFCGFNDWTPKTTLKYHWSQLIRNDGTNPKSFKQVKD